MTRLIGTRYQQDVPRERLVKALAGGQPDRFEIGREGIAVTAPELRDSRGTLFWGR